MGKDTRESRIRALLARMDGGELTEREVLRRLDAAIDSQLRLPRGRADLELLEACEALRQALTCREPEGLAAEAQDAAQIDAILGRLRRKRRRRRIVRRSLTAAAIAAAMMVLTFLGSILLERDYLISYDGQGGEVRVFEDIRKRLGLSKEVEANRDEDEEPVIGLKSFAPDEYGEFIDELGYEPLAVPYVPTGWSVVEYSHYDLISTKGYEITYQHEEEQGLLSLSVVDYDSAMAVSVEYQQDPGSGEYRKIRGRRVYCATNIGMRLYVWSEGLTEYSLIGPIEDEEGMKMLEALFEAQDS